MKWAAEMVGWLIAELRRAGMVEAELRATWLVITRGASGENSLEFNANCTKRKARCQILWTNNNKDPREERGTCVRVDLLCLQNGLQGRWVERFIAFHSCAILTAREQETNSCPPCNTSTYR